MTRNRYSYVVRSRATGLTITAGSADKCAKQLGIKKSSFYVSVNKSKDGEGKYAIEVIDLRKPSHIEMGASPCMTCRAVSECMNYQRCETWRLWYISRQERIRKMFGK